MHVDYERVVLRVKEEVTKKGSHGRRDLLALIATLEVECSRPESPEELDDIQRELQGGITSETSHGRGTRRSPSVHVPV